MIPRQNRNDAICSPAMTSLCERFEMIRGKIALAAQRAGRLPRDVALVAVSKTYPVDSIREAFDEAGQGLFGESRVQEALIKIPALPARLQWHFIGHLQSNKVRKALPYFQLFHGIDTLEIARDIDRIAGEMGLFPNVLLEVNVSGEGSKHGFSPEKLEADLEGLLSLPRIQIEGFMTMAPLAESSEQSRPFFAALRELRDRFAQQSGVPFSTLSMGMSGDYEVAVEEGATLVRVGSALFRENKTSC
jgi:pyridoxal phosphate enzyme (YggS family)